MSDRLNIPDPECWSCIIGEVSRSEMPEDGGMDLPMREAVAKAYTLIAGKDPEFIFSGWGKELPERYRPVVENREPAQPSSRDEEVRLRRALRSLQMGPDTLTQAGLRIVLDALYPGADETTSGGER